MDPVECLDLKILIGRMKHEAAEHRADSQRMYRILNAVGISPSSFGHNHYLNSLILSSSVLNTLTPDKVNLTLGLSDLTEEIETLKEMLESSHRRISKYRNELSNILKEKEWWKKALRKIEAEEENNQSECHKAAKSTLFHSKKKAQYETEIELARKGLGSVGYEESSSHESLVHLGVEVREMEEQLKPLRLQLKCYKDLPASLTQARVKLQEKRNSFNEIDQKFSEKLVDVAASTPLNSGKD